MENWRNVDIIQGELYIKAFLDLTGQDKAPTKFKTNLTARQVEHPNVGSATWFH